MWWNVGPHLKRRMAYERGETSKRRESHIYFQGSKGPGMPLNSPCWETVTQWIGGACPPAWNGPGFPIGVSWITKLGPSRLGGLRASAEVLGAGTEVLVASTFPVGCRGRRPKSRPVLGFDHPRANRCILNSCRDREAPLLSGACRLPICYAHKRVFTKVSLCRLPRT